MHQFAASSASLGAHPPSLFQGPDQSEKKTPADEDGPAGPPATEQPLAPQQEPSEEPPPPPANPGPFPQPPERPTPDANPIDPRVF